jgi:hypothetical protein
MRVRQYLAGILGAAVALIVLFAMPSVANAHAGHHDTGAQITSPNTAKPEPVAIQAFEQVTAEARSYTADADTAAPPCNSVTCCKKACAACGLAIADVVAAFDPVWTSLHTVMPQMRAPGGIRPDDLSRPPKSLA